MLLGNDTTFSQSFTLIESSPIFNLLSTFEDFESSYFSHSYVKFHSSAEECSIWKILLKIFIVTVILIKLTQ